MSKIPTVRLPFKLPKAERRSRIRNLVTDLQPDVVSLQFVAYGFHPKGLPWNLGAELRASLGEVPVHILFHEIWIGADPGLAGCRLKRRVTGAVQKFVHRRLVRHLHPFCVHTHAEPYRRALIEAGINARPLPLPSNVPQVTSPDFRFIRKQLTAAGIDAEGPEEKTFTLLLIFGNVPPEWDAGLLLQQLESLKTNSGRKPVLFFCGRGGLDDRRKEQIWALAGRHGVSCVSTGFLELDQVSALMQLADFGIATVPFALWQKSGVVAAMRAHGLPVIFTRFDGDWPQDWLPPWKDNFLRCDEKLAERLETPARSAPRDKWPEMVETFMTDISAR